MINLADAVRIVVNSSLVVEKCEKRAADADRYWANGVDDILEKVVASYDDSAVVKHQSFLHRLIVMTTPKFLHLERVILPSRNALIDDVLVRGDKVSFAAAIVAKVLTTVDYLLI